MSASAATDDGPFSARSLEVRERVLRILRRHGWNATSFQILEAHFDYWFDGEEACVAYVDTGSAWVVAGAPVAPLERVREVTLRFVEVAARHRRRASLFAVESRLAKLLAEDEVLLLGEQPVWDPRAWPDTLAASKSLREQLRRARAKGVEVRQATAADLGPADAPLRAKVESLIERWLASRSMPAMGFLVDVQPFAFPEERRYFVAEQGGALVGFLAAVPVYARGGWLFEDFIRDPRAPNGTAESLVNAAMRQVASEGSGYVTLGLAPLSGVRGWLGLVREWSGALYDFNGLRAFKAKLRPHAWEPVYMAHPGGSANFAVFDVLAAFAHGSFARFGLAAFLRGPAIVVRLLAALLVPWTAMVAIADDAAWFPSPAVKYAWIAFDVVLAAALFTLAARWHKWMGRAIAIVVTLDAALTLAQIVLFNAPRARGVVDGLVLAISWAAPTLAALALWGATRARAPAG